MSRINSHLVSYNDSIASSGGECAQVVNGGSCACIFFPSIRAQYFAIANEARFKKLRKRIEPSFYHTLRRQVHEYIEYTKRIAITETYTPNDAEQSFYEDFTAWLGRSDLYTVPRAQRALLTLVLHKLLATSTFAIQNALDRMAQRLEDLVAGKRLEQVLDDIEGVQAEAGDWDDGEDAIDTELDPAALARELVEIRQFRERVRAISTTAKGDKLLTALDIGFKKMRQLALKPFTWSKPKPATSSAILWFWPRRKLQNSGTAMLPSSTEARARSHGSIC